MPRLEDLDGLDMRFLAPADGLAFGHRTASLPFGVGARRDTCGPELARRVRGEVDYDAVRVDTLTLLRLCTLPVASMASNLTRMILRHGVAGSAHL